MRRSFISVALLANALAGGLVLLLLLNGGGWGEAARLSATEAEVLIVVAAAAFVLNLLLAPVLGISFWARDRGTRKLETRLAASRAVERPGEPPARAGASQPAGRRPAEPHSGEAVGSVGNASEA